jgi:UDP-glucose:(heptosyl)LPS alpha-1,3-glucosyltransferase
MAVNLRIALTHKRLDFKGGTERDLYRTAQGLRDLGHEIHLFCNEFGVAPPSGILVHRIPVLPLGRTARLWSFALFAPAIIRKQRCDVVLSFGRMLQADIVRCGGGTHVGFLERIGAESGRQRRFWQRVSPYHRSLLRLEKQQFTQGHFKKIIAVSNEVRRDIMVHYAVPEKYIAVLYNGVDQERFHPSLREKWRRQIRQEWGIPSEAPLVLFVGSGFRRKGLDHLLAVWNSLRLQHVYLLVVGQDTRMRLYRERAKAIAGERIIFAGRQDAVEKYYGAADVVALPSIQEAFGNVVLEALASGIPVVVNRGVGAADILQGEMANGIVTAPDDPSELTERIIVQLRQARGLSSIREARGLSERYSWQNHFRELETVLREVRAAKQSERVS